MNSMTCGSDCTCLDPTARKLLRSLNNAIAHIEWLTAIRGAAAAVIREHELQWPPYRLTAAINTLEAAIENYDNFTRNNEQSDFSLPDLSDLREPCEDR